MSYVEYSQGSQYTKLGASLYYVCLIFLILVVPLLDSGSLPFQVDPVMSTRHYFYLPGWNSKQKLKSCGVHPFIGQVSVQVWKLLGWFFPWLLLICDLELQELWMWAHWNGWWEFGHGNCQTKLEGRSIPPLPPLPLQTSIPHFRKGLRVVTWKTNLPGRMWLIEEAEVSFIYGMFLDFLVGK